jgi:flagellar hook-basal body complex protein FliE
MSMTGLQPIHQGLLVQGKSLQTEQTEGSSFRDILTQALQNVNKLEKESEVMTNDFIAGKTDSIHSVLIAAEKASLALDMVLEVRNKVLEAYTEIMRMQV